MATSRNQTTAKKEEAKTTNAPYAEQAAALADDARALAEGIREDLAKLRERFVDDFADTAPEPANASAADGVRRVPMAIDEVVRAIEGLTLVAAELSRAAMTG